MKRLLIILCFVICMTTLFSLVTGATNSDGTDVNSTPVISEATTGATPGAPDETPNGTGEFTAKPTPNNKGEIQVLNPGNTDAAVNSTGEIIFMGVIVAVCLFFVVEGIFSFFIQKKR